MASRKEQKEQAREQRLAKERAAKAAAQRQQRLMIFGGIAAAAVVVIVVIIAISSSGSSSNPTTSSPKSKANVAIDSRVSDLLSGIAQTPGSTIELGNPKAKVTITEFGDLECSVCDEVDLASGATTPDGQKEGYTGSGILDTIIKDEVRTGKAKLVYESLETATSSGATPGEWTNQQAAANAAGLQGKGWNYVELFYAEQGYERANYVNDAYLEGLAKQIPGLDYAKWYSDWKHNSAVRSIISTQNNDGTQLDVANELNLPANQRGASTPTLWVKGASDQKTFIGIQYKTAGEEVAAIEAAVKAAS